MASEVAIPEIKVITKNSLIRIYISGVLFLLLKKKEFIGLQSWKDDDGKYKIEFYETGIGGTYDAILTEYDTVEKWKGILVAIDQAFDEAFIF